MKKKNNSRTTTAKMVTIFRTEYEKKSARLASQDERIFWLKNQVEVLTEALRLALHIFKALSPLDVATGNSHIVIVVLLTETL